MSFSAVFLAAAEGEEQLRELPMPPIAYGAIALGAFALLLAFLWSFRGTAQKIPTRGAPHGQDDAHGGHGGAGGHGSGH